MKVELGTRQALGFGASQCFALGQKITEVGAALAYADNFSRGLAQSTTLAMKHVTAGIKTAEVASGKLKAVLHGRIRTEVEKFERDLGLFENDIRNRFGDWPTQVSNKDIIEIQRSASAFRQKATKIWDSLRLMCPERRAPAATRKSKKAR